MTTTLLKGGAQATINDNDGLGGLSIFLSQPKGSTARWKMSVRAHTDEGIYSVGELITSPPANNRLTRAIAIANCPGAVDWTVFVTLAAGEADNSKLSLAVGRMTSGPGLSRINERYKQYTGNADGVVNILAGETVVGWTAFSAGAGASVQIGNFAAIPLPNGGSMSGGGSGGLVEGPIPFTFAGGVAGYLIEVAESA